MLNPNAFVAFLPVALIKARTDSDGRRLVELCASTETVDLQGDCILQKALLDSAPSFIAGGHLDIDHKSELYEEFGITNPEAWIIGNPLKVWDGGDGQTMVLCQLRKSATHDPEAHTWDAVWDSLQTDPPVAWRASVYGFLDPAATTDCRLCDCVWDRPDPPPTRFLVSKFDWRSLAFTRNPVNTGIHKYARVVSAKSWVAVVKGGEDLAFRHVPPQAGALVGTVEEHTPAGDAKEHDEKEKGYKELKEEAQGAEEVEEPKAAGLLGEHRPPPRPSVPMIDAEIASGACPTCGGLRDAATIPMWQRHLRKCLGWSPSDAEVGANAAMYRLILSNGWGRRRGSKKFPEAPELTPEIPEPTIMGPGNESLNGGRFRPGHLAHTRP